MKIAEACAIIQTARPLADKEQERERLRRELEFDVQKAREAHTEASKVLGRYMAGVVRAALTRAGIAPVRYRLESGNYLRVTTEEERKRGFANNGRISMLIVERHHDGFESRAAALTGLRVEAAVDVHRNGAIPDQDTLRKAAQRAAAAFLAGLETP